MLDTVLQMLTEHPLERLKWRVCREFGVLPGAEAARQLTDYDYICCGVNLLLDKRMRELAERYKDRICGWEVTNELLLSPVYYPQDYRTN